MPAKTRGNKMSDMKTMIAQLLQGRLEQAEQGERSKPSSKQREGSQKKSSANDAKKQLKEAAKRVLKADSDPDRVKSLNVFVTHSEWRDLLNVLSPGDLEMRGGVYTFNPDLDAAKVKTLEDLLGRGTFVVLVHLPLVLGRLHLVSHLPEGYRLLMQMGDDRVVVVRGTEGCDIEFGHKEQS